VELRAFANYVNVATGRGAFKGNVGVGLNYVFFAPRLLMSRFQLLAGQPFYQGTWRTRKIIAKEYARSLSGITLLYALAAMAGASLEWDPRSSDFLKLRFGDTRIDPMFGLLQVLTFARRTQSGETKTAKGKILPLRGEHVKFGQGDWMDVAQRFTRSKLNPNLGMSVDIFAGQNVVGEAVTPTSMLWGSAPITFQDLYEAMRDKKNGVPTKAAASMLTLLGMGMQVYDEHKKRSKPGPTLVQQITRAASDVRRGFRGRADASPPAP
jgi:hypothetical protein